jgi:hypothetical protein
VELWKEQKIQINQKVPDYWQNMDIDVSKHPG